jgi:hypothetical protein
MNWTVEPHLDAAATCSGTRPCPVDDVGARVCEPLKARTSTAFLAAALAEAKLAHRAVQFEVKSPTRGGPQTR